MPFNMILALPTISLFLLWWAPITTLVIGGILGVAIYKKGLKKAASKTKSGVKRVFFKNAYSKEISQRLSQLDRELQDGVHLNKRFKKGFRKENPTRTERFMQALHVRRYEPKPLSNFAFNSRIRQMHKLRHYANKHSIITSTPYFDTRFNKQENTESIRAPRTEERIERSSRRYDEPRRGLEEPKRVSEETSKRMEESVKKEYIYSKRDSKFAAHESMVVTSSKKAQETFNSIVSTPTFNEDIQTIPNKMYIFTADKKNRMLENVVSKNPALFYSTSADVMEDLAVNAPESVYPLKVSQTIMMDGKPVWKEKEFSKEQLLELSKKYRSQIGEKKEEVIKDGKEVEL